MIYRQRHEVYARELGQHNENSEGRLTDPLDNFNTYIAATVEGRLAGFVSLTPPGHNRYSVDKYFARDMFPFSFDGGLHEVRLLTVLHPYRHRLLAPLLMYAALRWAESRGATRLVAIGRTDVLALYLKAGLNPLGMRVQAGNVAFEALTASTDELNRHLMHRSNILARMERRTEWDLPVPFRKQAPCFHGGASMTEVGERFETLDRRQWTISADVLDAWFPPPPAVLDVLEEHLPWLVRTSPPSGCEGLVHTVSECRGIPRSCVLPGSGSSDLMFRIFPLWLQRNARVLLLDPTYGEYQHLFNNVIGCHVERLLLHRGNRYDVAPQTLREKLHQGFDLVVLVNPNSPTGRHVPRDILETLLGHTPESTLVWIDETYVDYAEVEQSEYQSLERFAAASNNVVVCKSMSKVYALSGLRVGYLCAGAHLLEALRTITPPWTVNLLGQVAAVKALQHPEYYAARYQETRLYREALADDLRSRGLDVIPGVANFLLCHLDPASPSAAMVVEACKAYGLYLRNAGLISPCLGRHALRIAVKDADTNQRMISILDRVLKSAEGGSLCSTKEGRAPGLLKAQ